MLIHCWGARGSVAVSGKEYIKYGGDTSCIEVTSNAGDLIIIDAGTGIRALGNKLVKKNRLNINLLLTHAHWDHLSGFPFFSPIYKKKSVIKVYGPQTTQLSLKKIVSKTMASPYFPIELEDIHAEIEFIGMGNKNYEVGSVTITTIPIKHPNEGVGYKLEEDGKSFVFLTDNELTYEHPTGLEYEDYVEFIRGVDLLFHDAEYNRKEYKKTRGWGHSVYLDTLKLAMDAEVKSLGLFHHNQDRTDKQLTAIEKDCKAIIAKSGSKLKCFAAAEGMDIDI
jgi:phosphoribosyl 1,2-cyclic phosphodiesterase